MGEIRTTTMPLGEDQKLDIPHYIAVSLLTFTRIGFRYTILHYSALHYGTRCGYRTRFAEMRNTQRLFFQTQFSRKLQISSRYIHLSLGSRPFSAVNGPAP